MEIYCADLFGVKKLLWEVHAVPLFYNSSDYHVFSKIDPSSTLPSVTSSLHHSKKYCPNLASIAEKLVSLELKGTDFISRIQHFASIAPPFLLPFYPSSMVAVWVDDLLLAFSNPSKLSQASFSSSFNISLHSALWSASIKENAKGAALVTLLDESARDVMKNIWYWTRFSFAKQAGYPLWLFYIQKTLEADEEALIKERMPDHILKFLPVQYSVPKQFWSRHNQLAENHTKNYGYIYCSQFLGYELFLHPLMETVEYYFRFDEDTRPFTNSWITWDPFLYMKSKNIMFATPQTGLPSLEWDNSLSDHVWKYIADVRGGEANEGWRKSQCFYARYNTTAWDRFVYAGCVEVAKVSLYQNDAYYQFLSSIDWLEGVYFHGWLDKHSKPYGL